MMPKCICVDCANYIRVSYRFHAIFDKDRTIKVGFCRFGIPSHEYDIRKCEEYHKRGKK